MEVISSSGRRVRLGVAVAVEAPLHGQRLDLLHRRHLVHPAVAGVAAHALVHVDGVVEVDEVGEVMDARPGDGAVVEVLLADERQQRALVPDLGVGSSCRCWSRGRPRTASAPPPRGSSGSRCPRRPRGGGGRTRSAAPPGRTDRSRTESGRRSSAPRSPAPASPAASRPSGETPCWSTGGRARAYRPADSSPRPPEVNEDVPALRSVQLLRSVSGCPVYGTPASGTKSVPELPEPPSP